MPAKNPRLTITLKPSTAAVLRRMSELTGNSQSALISELLEANEPVFERLALVLQAAKDAKATLNEEMASGLQQAEQRLEEQLGLVLETMNTATAPILEAAERVQRRGRRDARSAPADRAAAPSTPMSNRGVRSRTTPPTKAKKPTSSRRRHGPL